MASIIVWLLLISGCSAELTKYQCSYPNRHSCANVFVAEDCGTLNKCGDLWQSSQWVEIKKDLSAQCTACRYLSSDLLDVKTLSSKDWLNFTCEFSGYKNRCLRLTPFLSSLRTPKDRYTIVCNLLNMCQSHRYIGDLNLAQFSASPICDDCLKVFEDVRKLVGENATAQAISEKLDALICDSLPSTMEDICKELVNSHIPFILKDIQSRVNPHEICSLLNLCPEQNVLTLPGRMALRQYPNRTSRCSRKSLQLSSASEFSGRMSSMCAAEQNVITDANECSDCRDVFLQMQAALSDSDSRHQMEQEMDIYICSGNFICTELLHATFGTIVADLQKPSIPNEACAFFGMCSKLSESETADNNIVSQAALQPAVPLPGVCELCEIVVAKVFNLVVSNHSEEAIKAALDEACNLIPTSYRDQCLNVVDNYGSKIINAIISGTAPKLVCATVGLCTPFEPRAEVVPLIRASLFDLSYKSGTCDTCRLFVQILEAELSRNATEEQVKEWVQKACSYLPHAAAESCSQLVDRYLDIVIKYLTEHWTAEDICEELSLCPSSLEDRVLCSDSKRVCSSLEKLLQCGSVAQCLPVGSALNLFSSTDNHIIHSLLNTVCRQIPRDQRINGNRFNLNLLMPAISALRFSMESSSFSCDVCEELLQKWTLQLSLFGGLLKDGSLCRQYTTDNDQQQCQATLQNRNSILSHLRRNGDRKKACQHVLRCESPSSASTVPTWSWNLLHKQSPRRCRNHQRFSWINRPTSRSSPMSLSHHHRSTSVKVPSCGTCKKVLHNIQSKLNDPELQAKIEEALDTHLCHNLPMCTSWVNSRISEVVAALEGWNLDRACNYFGMCQCPPKAPTSLRSPTTQFVSRSQCSLCKTVVDMVFQLLPKEKTREVVTAALDQVCKLFDHDRRIQCEAFVENFGEQLVESIIKGTVAELVCEEVGLCSTAKSNEKLRTLPAKFLHSNSCNECQLLLIMLHDELQVHGAEKMEWWLKRECGLFSYPINEACTQVSSILMEHLKDDVSPEVICKILGFCIQPQARTRLECAQLSHACSSWEAVLKCSSLLQCVYSDHFKNLSSPPALGTRTSEKMDAVCSYLNHLDSAPINVKPRRDEVFRFLLNITNSHQAANASLTEAGCHVCPRLLAKWKLMLAVNGRAQDDNKACVNYHSHPSQYQECVQSIRVMEKLLNESMTTGDTARVVCQRVLGCGGKRRTQKPAISNPVTAGAKPVPRSGSIPCIDYFHKDCCRWGPEYFCQSEATAKSCGEDKVMHCRTRVWKTGSN